MDPRHDQSKHDDDDGRAAAADGREAPAAGGADAGLEPLPLMHEPGPFGSLGDDDGARDVGRSLHDDLNALNNEIFRSLSFGGDMAYGQSGPLASMAGPDDSLAALQYGMFADASAHASVMGLKPAGAAGLGLGGAPGAAGLGLGGGAFDHAASASPEAALGEQQAEPPLPLGGYLDPGAHVFTSADPCELLQAAADAATAEGADCRVAHHRFQVSALCYCSGHEISFKARVFLSPRPEQGKYALEIQRRQGDAWAFWDVYRAVMARLEGKGLVRGASPSANLADGLAPALEFDPSCLDDVEVSAEHWQEGVTPLLHMAQADSPQTQFEGLRALSQEAAKEPGARDALLRTDETFRTLVDALASEHRNVHRCALSTLVALAAADASPYPEQLSADEDAVRFVLKLLGSDVLEVKREAVRVLVAISDANASLLGPAAEMGLASHVRRLTHSPDAFLRRQAEVLRTRFME